MRPGLWRREEQFGHIGPVFRSRLSQEAVLSVEFEEPDGASTVEEGVSGATLQAHNAFIDSEPSCGDGVLATIQVRMRPAEGRGALGVRKRCTHVEISH